MLLTADANQPKRHTLPLGRNLHLPTKTLEWFSKRTGTSFQNGARSKNVDKKLGRERRRVVLKSDLAVVATRILTSAFLKITITFEFSVL